MTISGAKQPMTITAMRRATTTRKPRYAPLERLEVFLDLERSPASRAGGRDRLFVADVEDIAGDEHAGDLRRHAVGRTQVPGIIEIELPAKDRGVRVVTDRNEQRVGGDRAPGVLFQVVHDQRVHRRFAEHLDDRAVPDHVDLRVRQRTLGHDLAGA